MPSVPPDSVDLPASDFRIPRAWPFVWAAAAFVLAAQVFAVFAYRAPFGFETFLFGLVAAIPAVRASIRFVARRTHPRPLVPARYLPVCCIAVVACGAASAAIGYSASMSALASIAALTLLFGLPGTPVFLAALVFLFLAGLALVSGAPTLAQDHSFVAYWFFAVACVDEIVYQLLSHPAHALED